MSVHCWQSPSIILYGKAPDRSLPFKCLCRRKVPETINWLGQENFDGEKIFHSLLKLKISLSQF